nr:transposase [Corynebacterium diphtheriae]
MTTLYFETPKEDELRAIGMRKKRRVDPQIIVGLVTDNNGFPLHIDFFHGRTAETTTLIPMMPTYQHAHDLQGLTVVADAAMLSARNLDALDAAGIDYIVADRLKKAPHMVTMSDDDLEEWSKRTDTYEVVESTKAMGPKDAPRSSCLVEMSLFLPRALPHQKRLDVVKEILSSYSIAADDSLCFGHVSMQLGKPQGCAQIDSTTILCLPGNPVSSPVFPRPRPRGMLFRSKIIVASQHLGHGKILYRCF